MEVWFEKNDETQRSRRTKRRTLWHISLRSGAIYPQFGITQFGWPFAPPCRFYQARSNDVSSRENTEFHDLKSMTFSNALMIISLYLAVSIAVTDLCIPNRNSGQRTSSYLIWAVVQPFSSCRTINVLVWIASFKLVSFPYRNRWLSLARDRHSPLFEMILEHILHHPDSSLRTPFYPVWSSESIPWLFSQISVRPQDRNGQLWRTPNNIDEWDASLWKIAVWSVPPPKNCSLAHLPLKIVTWLAPRFKKWRSVHPSQRWCCEVIHSSRLSSSITRGWIHWHRIDHHSARFFSPFESSLTEITDLAAILSERMTWLVCARKPGAQLREAIHPDHIAGAARFESLLIARKSLSEAGECALVQGCVGNCFTDLPGSAEGQGWYRVSGWSVATGRRK
jgi:hypothetical protein